MPNDGLQDLMLNEHESNKNTNFKRLLTIIAAFFILFLIIIAIIGIFNGNDENEAQNTQSQSRLALPPIQAQQDKANLDNSQNQAKQSNTAKDNESLFEQVPIVAENKADEDFESMIKRLKEQESQKTNEPVQQQLPTKKIDEPKPIQNQQTSKTEHIKQAPTQESKKQENPKQNIQKQVSHSKEQKPQAKQNTPPKQQNASSLQKGAYVQVAAVSKINPDSSYLKKITAKGHKYHLLKVGSAIKILVGPFKENELKSALSEIRNEIAKEAFTYRVK